MQLILIKDVDRLGKAGDVVKVRDGYARNFLVPKGLALEAAQKDIKFLENEKKKFQIKQKKLKKEAQDIADKLRNISCTIAMTTGEENRLYGEVTAEMISDFYRQEGLEINRRRIHLEKPIRHLGVYQADIKLHPEVAASIKVWVVKK